MTATHRWCVTHGASPGTDVISATNLNLLSIDDHDQNGELYKTNPVRVPDTGTNHSYERWFFSRFSGTYNRIENQVIWRKDAALSDPDLDLCCGTSAGLAYKNPVDTDSTYADIVTANWTGEAKAFDIGPTLLSGSGGEDSDYAVMQLDVPSTVTTPGDIGDQTIYWRYDES